MVLPVCCTALLRVVNRRQATAFHICAHFLIRIARVPSTVLLLLLMALGRWLLLNGSTLLLLRCLLHLLLEFLDSGLDPRVTECIFGCHALIWFPLKALVDEVNKVYLCIICLHHLGQVLRANMSHFALRIRLLEWSIVIVKEHFATACHHYHRSRRYSFNFHDTLHLLFFIFSSKNWESNEELIENATERPHINRWGVSDSHHDLWRTVESTLNVGVELVWFIRTRSKVNDFDSTLITLSQKDIFRFHITMNYLVFFHVVKRHEDLNCKATNKTFWHALKVIHFYKLI